MGGQKQSTYAPIAAPNTVSSTALSISHSGWAALGDDLLTAEIAIISTSGSDVRILYTGQDPTISFGIYIGENGNLTVSGNRNIQNLKFIRASGSDAIVTILLEKFASNK